MSENTPNRLDRIEAALENLQQRLDNQVVVNAELRTSITELRTTAEALLQTAQIHQQNFELLTSRQIQIESQLQEYQRTTSAALDRIGTVLDYLVRERENN